MRVCILGGGTAGWMTASALSKKVKNLTNSITLVESEAIGTVGVGEATLPHIRFFNQGLGIEESAFMRATEATFKLGIEFCDWGRIGQRYIHPFGDFGTSINELDFYQHWIKLNQHGDFGSLDEYAYGIMAAKQGKFQLPESGKTELQRAFGYAYQFDSSLYAKFLRQFSENNGVVRIEGKVINVMQDQQSGNVTNVTLDSGQIIEADLFIDCSGFRGVLIEQSLKSGYQDWSQWLPCNRAVAVPCESTGAINPYTRATARKAGWQWRIPLQHRTGNGHVYWNEFISDDEATNVLMSNLDGKALAEPKQLFFKTGRRNHFWKNNVVAIGLSGGFLEPLESTSIHLIQEGITALLELFPVTQDNKYEVQEYNNRMGLQYERVRDFLLLHYVANERTDSEMWRYFSNMTLPDSLQEKIDAWLHRGYVQRYEFGTFLPPSWVAVMMGQNLIPQAYDPRVDKSDFQQIKNMSQSMRKDIAQSVATCQSHMDYIKTIGAASNSKILRAP
ncbi:tryptophan halogenase family protein [Glaciecola petra]|uniref:Tryptophan halogenase family protein n=1 Tax=Glaciecola petra TaxID=3075602 RepID=A0ABU2ZKT8_9ALTE|nr:tryptophan halogenase family protein [Aestuariibacter sp. P117]MDT0593236.1 tryptophan halogenase family protein [Aestuariibacter sp. P117]